jgi:hypothetical protein
MTLLQQPSDSEMVPREMLGCTGKLISVNGLSRREVVALLTSVAMGLAGCSSAPSTGSGPPPPPPPPPAGLGQVTGSVSLPSGSGLSPSTLSLKVMGQSIGLTAAATFSVGVSPSAPTMALLTDADGNGVMAGFLDSTVASSQTIDPRSTGAVLTWFALGGPFLPANVKSQVLALLSADPTMDTLGGVIAQRIAAVPLAIVNADAQVATALNAAVATLTAGTAGSIGGTADLAAVPYPTISVKSEPNDGSAPSTQTTQGGVNVQSDNTIAGIDIANSYRRPVRAYVYETQTLTAGVVMDISPATLFAGPFDLGEPATLAPTSGIHPFVSQPAPFHSFTISPIALVLDGASDQTTYEVVVIGPSASGVIPPFFGAARYANEVAGWTAAIDNLSAQSFYTDVVHALLLEMTGLGSILPTSPNLVAAGVNTRSIYGNPLANTNTIGLPNSPQALGAQLAIAINDFPAIVAAAKRNSKLLGLQDIEETIVDPNVAAVIAKMNSIDWQASVQSGASFAMKLTLPLSNLPNYQANGALGKLLANLANADPGLLWQVEAGKAQVTITPPNPAVNSPGGMVALTAVLSSDLTGTYEFDWSSNSVYATFSAADQPGALAAITTRDLTVNLNTSPRDVSPIVVTLAVYEVVGGTRAFLTRLTTTVTLLQKSTLSPPSAVLAVGDQKTFIVNVSGTLPPTGVKYVWSVVGGSGSIGPTSPVTTTAPQITYTAQQKGTDTLSVQVLDANNNLLSAASAAIGVASDSYIELTIAGTWDPTRQPPDGSYTYVDGFGLRQVATGQPNLDAIGLIYDVVSGNTGTVPAVSIYLFLAPGAPVSQGQVFTNYGGTGVFSPGQFVLDLALNQTNPSDPNGGTYAARGTGTFTITSLGSGVGGTTVMKYTLNIASPSGGVISATGSGQWV